ncbi:Triosephosphate isomerase [invertebrate metagenome]|uniref:triose-phosphate isomerase n=1 Tax=invertebrate metagenome TaxID=1711999 RepID=A0A484H8Z0_9ZZZZ
MARRPLIAGNWKMNGLLADSLAGTLANLMKSQQAWSFEMVVCPPFTLLHYLGTIIAGSGLALGAQDCHTRGNGAHTGDISPIMLKDVGCSYVILGHSERRTDHGEDDALVRAKATAALEAGLKVILCIGETEAERDSGKTLLVNQTQLRGSIPAGVHATNLVIAYEPVWAIGTGRTPTNPEIQDIHAFIRKELITLIGAEAERVRILYGGSMKPGNAGEILALTDVDGGLIGGASLKAEDFWAIAQQSA